MDVVNLGLIQMKIKYIRNDWEAIQLIDLIYAIYLRLSTVMELGIQITTGGNLEGNYLFFTPICFIVYFGQDFIFNTPLILFWKNSSMSS